VARVIDSNIVIDALNDHQAAVDEMLAEEDCRISRVSWMEVLVGCQNLHADRLARDLMATLRVVEISAQIAEAAVTIRKHSRLKLPDAIVLATARTAGLQLSTRNTKDFSEADPTIRIPYRL